MLWKKKVSGAILKQMGKIKREEMINDRKIILKLVEILYLIFDYPHKHYTFKYFEV